MPKMIKYRRMNFGDSMRMPLNENASNKPVLEKFTPK